MVSMFGTLSYEFTGYLHIFIFYSLPLVLLHNSGGFFCFCFSGSHFSGNSFIIFVIILNTCVSLNTAVINVFLLFTYFFLLCKLHMCTCDLVNFVEHVLFFHFCLNSWDQTQVSRLTEQMPYLLNHLSSIVPAFLQLS